MTRPGKRPLSLLLLAMVILLAAGCKEILEKLGIQRIEVAPACSVANVGQTVSFGATAYDPLGNPISQVTFAWSSSDNAVASVDGSGQARALSGGNVFVTAEAEDKNGQSLFSVNPITSVHNCRPFEWYQTQMGTGSAAGNNCGPTSTHMAIKWQRNTTSNIPSVEEIRSFRPNNGGWWNTSDIDAALKNWSIPFAIRKVNSADDILACLQRGRIVLLCIEMKWITYDRHAFYDRFYTYNSGHFLIIKGYSEDGQYFIVYDPNSWKNDYYADNTAMGRNRYYKRSELFDASSNWWSWGFEIGAPSTESTADLAAIPVGRSGPWPPEK